MRQVRNGLRRPTPSNSTKWYRRAGFPQDSPTFASRRMRKLRLGAGFRRLARTPHNPKVAGSNPAPATNPKSLKRPRFSAAFRVSWDSWRIRPIWTHFDALHLTDTSQLPTCAFATGVGITSSFRVRSDAKRRSQHPSSTNASGPMRRPPIYPRTAATFTKSRPRNNPI